MKARQGESFTRAVETMLQCSGRVVVMGMGKSGHVGRKIAATLASTGTPAMFVHPGGSLGRKLRTHVRDVMRSGDAVPRVLPQTPFIEMMREMTKKGLGATAIADERGRVLGIFTDGDLRRLLEQGMDLRGLTAQQVMHPNPRLVREDALAVDAADAMEQYRITSVLVIDAAQLLIGALNSNDLMRAKVI